MTPLLSIDESFRCDMQAFVFGLIDRSLFEKMAAAVAGELTFTL
jgi:hypothetical protein